MAINYAGFETHTDDNGTGSLTMRFITVAYTSTDADPHTLICGASIFRCENPADTAAYKAPATQDALRHTALCRQIKRPFTVILDPSIDILNAREVKAALKAHYKTVVPGEKRHWIVRGARPASASTSASTSSGTYSPERSTASTTNATLTAATSRSEARRRERRAIADKIAAIGAAACVVCV